MIENWKEEFEKIRQLHLCEGNKIIGDIYANYSISELKERIKDYKEKFEELKLLSHNIEKQYLYIEIGFMENKLERLEQSRNKLLNKEK
jgi:hypothetical protein